MSTATTHTTIAPPPLEVPGPVTRVPSLDELGRLTSVPDRRVVFRGVDWAFYDRLVDSIPESSSIHVDFDGTDLEVMGNGWEHEDIADALDDFVKAVAVAMSIACKSLRETTWRRPEISRGLQADQCYYFQPEKIAQFARVRGLNDISLVPNPDLAIEVDISRPEIDRAGIYAALGVIEIWRFVDNQIMIERLTPDGTDHAVETSGFLPVRASDVQRWVVDEDRANDTAWLERVQAEFKKQAKRTKQGRKKYVRLESPTYGGDRVMSTATTNTTAAPPPLEVPGPVTRVPSLDELERLTSVPDRRVVFRGVDWAFYDRLVDSIPESSNIHVDFDGTDLEVMGKRRRHENARRKLRQFIEAVAHAARIEFRSAGETTWKRAEVGCGLEADECYYFLSEKIAADIAALARQSDNISDYPNPDLAVEIDLSPPQVDRAGIYAALNVTEVWRFNGKQVVIDRLTPDGTYSTVDTSLFLPVQAEDIRRWIVDEDSSEEIAWTERLQAEINTRVLNQSGE